MTRWTRARLRATYFALRVLTAAGTFVLAHVPIPEPPEKPVEPDRITPVACGHCGETLLVTHGLLDRHRLFGSDPAAPLLDELPRTKLRHGG